MRLIKTEDMNPMQRKRMSALVIAVVFIGFLFFTSAGSAVHAVHAEAQLTTTHTCYFYAADGRLIKSVDVVNGDVLVSTIAPTVPEIAGMSFSYWYRVDSLLQGKADVRYLFDHPVMEPVYLMAYYEPIMENETVETDSTTSELPEADTSIADAPEVDESEADASIADASEADVSEVDAPEVDVSETDASEVGASEANAPEADVSEVGASEANAPEAGASEADVSEVDEPEADASETDEPEADESEADESEVDASEANAPETDEPRVFLKEEIDAMNPNRKITFYASWGNKPAPELGDQITIHAKLSGYERLVYTIRWQMKYTVDQEEWQDMDITGEECILTLTPENLDWLFRVAVDIADVE
jgi:hypothetical protein